MLTRRPTRTTSTARFQSAQAYWRMNVIGTVGSDRDAVGFYAANNFAVTSVGEKYPGVERFRVHLRAPVNPEPDL
jgi:hypothetical protein